MTDPFTQPAPKGTTPYWVRDPDQEAEALHVRLLKKLASLYSGPPAKQLPNPGARTWHD